MPRKYVAKNPRGSKFKNTPLEELARQAIQRGHEIHEARVRCVTAALKRELRHTTQPNTVEILCGYMQLDEIEMILTDLRAKRKHADAMAEKDRHRQAS